MPNRRFKFYAEIVAVTVLSLIAAHSWDRFLSKALEVYFPGSIVDDLIVAIVITGIAIYLLYLLFSQTEEKGPYDAKQKDTEGNPLPAVFPKGFEDTHPEYSL
ncbi:hypothetical protein OAG24_00930 [bacterium]|nr:hypothetical protein [bacterium]